VSNKQQRMQNANNYRALMNSLPSKYYCSNCNQPTHQGHFVPPSFGEDGFYACELFNADDHRGPQR